jgi:hypothetical protein
MQGVRDTTHHAHAHTLTLSHTHSHKHMYIYMQGVARHGRCEQVRFVSGKVTPRPGSSVARAEEVATNRAVYGEGATTGTDAGALPCQALVQAHYWPACGL